MTINRINKVFFAIGLLLTPSLALAQDGLSGGNTSWILTSTALVLFMTLPGLSLFYGGLVRTRNVLSVLMQCFAIAVCISSLWVLVGYSIAFGPSESAYWGGLSKALFAGVDINSMSGDIPETVFAAFQMTFAIITPALIVGAWVERMKFSSMLLFCVLWALLVYFPVANWVWGGGWLGQMGLIDFAGGTVVHVTAGVAALVTAIVLGKRKDFLTSSTLPHNLTMSFTGAAMLWAGWFGFNAGSALAADGAAVVALEVPEAVVEAGRVDVVVHVQALQVLLDRRVAHLVDHLNGLAVVQLRVRDHVEQHRHRPCRADLRQRDDGQEQLLPLQPTLLHLAEHVSADGTVRRAVDAVVLLLLHGEVRPQDLLQRVLLGGLAEGVVGSVLHVRLVVLRLPGEFLNLLVSLGQTLPTQRRLLTVVV